MLMQVNGAEVELDSEGYLIRPEDWNREIAVQLAATEKLVLTDEHWQVLAFMRDYYDEHQVAADARFVVKYLAEAMGYGGKARQHLFELFPYGYVQQACKVAGMKRPRAWSTG
ncbi:MAG: TusE/DsrC/DsvC family sulfur relay protein [Thiohalomonadaceae bacterium]